MAEHIIAVFETEANASSAVRSLKIAGIAPGAIRQYSGNLSNRSGAITETQEPESGGFWAWLFGDEPVSDTTRSAYASDMDMYDRRLRAGNCIVSVMVDKSMIQDAIEVLNRYNPLNIDEHTDEHGYADHPGAYGTGEATHPGAYGTTRSTETLPSAVTLEASGIGEGTLGSSHGVGSSSYTAPETTPGMTPTASTLAQFSAGDRNPHGCRERGESSRSRKSSSRLASEPSTEAPPRSGDMLWKSQSRKT